MTGFDIAGRHIGDGSPCLIVAEVAQAHEGSLSLAHAYIDAIADAGADAVKFQCHIAAAESTLDEPWRVEPKWAQDANRYEYWRRMEFSGEQWAGLAQHAKDRGLIFLCSPFSVQAVELLNPLVPAWKVASGEITNYPLLAQIAQTRKPVILSTGMANEKELESAVRALSAMGAPGLALLQCTSLYPCPPERVGWSLVQHGLGPYACHGLSDHSGTIWPSLAAVTLGAAIVEVHVKLSKHDQGFDASSSITVEDLGRLVEGVRFIEKAKQPVDKDQMARELEPMRELFLRKHERREGKIPAGSGYSYQVSDAVVEIKR